MQFAVTPCCKPQESIIGYCLRLAKRNGFTTIRDMLSDPVILRLAKGLKSGVFELDALLPDTAPMGQASVRCVLFKKPHSILPRICLTCIAQDNVIPVSHQSPFIYRCDKHNDVLIDTCSHCTHPLHWDVDLLNARCTNASCQRPLRACKSVLPDSLPPQDLSDCLFAGIFARNPHKLSIKTHTFAKCYHIRSIIEDGFELLTQERRAKRWLAETMSNFSHQLPITFRTIPIALLQRHLKSKNWPANEVFKQLAKCEYDNAAGSNCSVPPLLTHADVAMQLFGVELFELKQLQQFELIITTSAANLNKGVVVDISPVFNALSFNTTLQQMPTLKELMPLLHASNITVGKILEAILTQRLASSYLPSYDILTSLRVDPDCLLDLIKALKSQSTLQKLTLSEASKLTGLTEKKLLSLRENGIIKKLPWDHDFSLKFCSYNEIVKLQKAQLTKQMVLQLPHD